jgi:PBP1b-binding outer membrane lipoprotein LpoB
MHKRVVIALMLMLSVFVFVGCSSDDETEDSKADLGPTTIAVEDTGP